MNWKQLVSIKRNAEPADKEQQRSPFQRDFDRIVFSSAFRRLQDKTQVHPFPDSDYIRRRLTHSLEVSCVGRSLGTNLGNLIKQKLAESINDDELHFNLGQIVANACLCHDIGNPPFGHAGEKAIGSWFEENLPSLNFDLTPEQRSDLIKFEGNAQGFRLLTKLQDNREGGLNLTYATLAAFMKYPTSSSNVGDGYVGRKKHGFFSDDKFNFESVAKDVGLIQDEKGWRRHPLVFLMEAADDICYRIIDVEDAFKLKRLSFDQAKKLLEDISNEKSDGKHGNDETIGWLRAKAIGTLIDQVSKKLEERLSDIMNGTYSQSLIEDIEAADAIETAYKNVEKEVFKWDRTISAEIAGAQMITDVLERLIGAVKKPKTYKNKMLLNIVPHYKEENSTYEKILTVTDFISGMTDTYLSRIHKRLMGHAIL